MVGVEVGWRGVLVAAVTFDGLEVGAGVFVDSGVVDGGMVDSGVGDDSELFNSI